MSDQIASPPKVKSVLWDLSVGFRDFGEKVKAAAAGGFDVLTMPSRVFQKWVREGGGASEMVAQAADAGVSLDFLDGLSSWAPIRYPRNVDPWIKAAFDVSVEEGFQICEALGLTSIVAVGAFERGAIPITQLTDCFGRFCDQAAMRGIWVDLEFMHSIDGIPDLQTAWEIVRQANCPNSGIMLDTWHFMRGNPDFDLLGGLPAERVVNIQLVDGGAVPGATNPLEDALHFRSLPGEGELGVADIVALIAAKGRIASVGPEISNREIHALSPEEAGRRCANATMSVCQGAGLNVSFGSTAARLP